MSNVKPHIRISATAVSSTFVDDIRAIIEQGKQQAYMSVNTTSLKNWQMSTAKVTLRVTFVPSGSSMPFSQILTFGNHGFQI